MTANQLSQINKDADDSDAFMHSSKEPSRRRGHLQILQSCTALAQAAMNRKTASAQGNVLLPAVGRKCLYARHAPEARQAPPAWCTVHQ